MHGQISLAILPRHGQAVYDDCMKTWTRCFASVILAVGMLPGGLDGMQAGAAAKTPDKGKSSDAGKAAPPSAQDIAAAQGKGLVWVNTSTHVYHKAGPSYGTTKHGKFMAEADATKAGYRAAKEPVAKKAATSK
jgi:hypothetical protein